MCGNWVQNAETNLFKAIQYTKGEAIYEGEEVGTPVDQAEIFEVEAEEPIEQAEPNKDHKYLLFEGMIESHDFGIWRQQQ